ncbi:MAG: AMP-binding protein [Thermoleophilaceae bacterium]
MVWTSGYEPVEVGGTTLPAMVLDAAATAGERPALVDGASGARVSYATLAERIESVAAGLRARGFGEGDVLALWAPNLPQWAGVALGAMAAGGTVTGIPPQATERELNTHLRDSGASVLVTLPSLAQAARSAAEMSAVRDLIALGPAPGAVAIEELLARGRTAPVASEAQCALLPYSSGTTGLPKGVVLSHRNLVTAARQINRALRISSRDTVLAVVPFCHVMGFVIKLAVPLSAGATVVTVPRFDLDRFLELIEQHRVTVMVVPPAIATALARQPRAGRHELSSLELVVSGGAPLSAEVQAELAARLPHAAVGQGWGMTETSAGATAPDRERGSVPGSVGRVMADTELRVIDPVSGADLGAGERGELLVRGPQVMEGYLNRPADTAEILGPDGWLRTGDLGEVDTGGNVFVVERLKELIKVNAHQVAPAELEGLISTHPAVHDVAVIARPDERRGEMPVAVVVTRGELDAGELVDWVAERVSPFKRLGAVRFAASIPRTPSGKVLRRLLAEEERTPV